MDPFVEWLFIQEISNECEWAALAYKKIGPSLQGEDVMGVWFAIHAFLSHAANVSKVLDPGAPESKQRGDELRNKLNVTKSSPVFVRKFRNHLEHYDERLEEWAKSSKDHHMADLNIMSRRAVTGLAPGNYHRNFDPYTWLLSFWGDDHDLRAVAQALEEVHKSAQDWLRKNRSPWP